MEKSIGSFVRDLGRNIDLEAQIEWNQSGETSRWNELQAQLQVLEKVEKYISGKVSK